MAIKISNGDKNEINIFELGTLLQFETHSWQARAGIPQEIKQRMTKETDWVSGYKRLIKKERLAGINSVITAARTYIWDVSNFSLLKSVHFVSNTIVQEVDEKLQKFSADLKEEVEKFANDYDKWIKESKKALNADGLFDKNAYPDDVRSSYSIEWRWFDMVVPSGITEEMRKKEQAEFQNMMDETKHNCILALRNGFSKSLKTCPTH